jgi:hypothetical protein
MNACFPVLVDRTMAFTTELVAFRKINQLSVIESQFIPIFCIMAVKTPSHGLRMMQLDLRMFLFQLSLFPVDLHGGMAVAAGEDAFGHRGRSNRELLVSATHRRDQTNPS